MNKFVSTEPDGGLQNNFGIEVKEVEFREFDRRNQIVQEASEKRFERRGFMSEVDHLIRDLNTQTARAYSTKSRKKN